MVNNGAKYERDLYKMIDKLDTWKCVRVAGSGTMENADADLLAGNKGLGKQYGIEVKKTKKESKYISKEQIDRLFEFCRTFGLTPILAVRFTRPKEWWFVIREQIRKNTTNKSIKVTREGLRERGFTFEGVFNEN